LRVYSDKASSAAHVVGFHNHKYGRIGVEAFHIYYLMGYNNNIFERIYQKAFLPQERGNDIMLTIDIRLQEYINSIMSKQKKKGSIVLLNPVTGEVLAMVSYPNFNPNSMDDVPEGNFVNRATQGLYPPGSTFKLVTAASALDSIEDIQKRNFDCTGFTIIDNEKIPCYHGKPHGELGIKQAIAVSCNTVFAQLGTEIGWKRVLKTARDFGFNDDFLFSDIKVNASNLPLTYKTKGKELAWTAIGQGKVLVTPLHAAMIAASIANDGIMMEPKLMYKVVGRNGRIQKQIESNIYRKSTTIENAELLKSMMEASVSQGTGREAKSKIVTIAGKTGTAEVGSSQTEKKNHAWFIGFAPTDNPTLAVAVLLEDVGEGKTGGSQAAPVARKVIEKAIELGY
jgi:peptidoglycan glycosyltransferase